MKKTKLLNPPFGLGSGGGASDRVAVSCFNDLLKGARLFPLSINQFCVLNQVPREGVALTDFPSIGLVVQLEARQGLISI